ncbi:MAG: NAD-dependent epimerase/dehydratase family protein [Bacteroidales bacterium]|nr:NAD-dependent epimerase/dehydratase family protein [Bacteroidales bacterium]
MKVLVTGAAGFIGFHLIEALIKRGYSVIGIDNINDYYSTDLKYARLEAAGIAREEVERQGCAVSARHPQYRFERLDITNREAVEALFECERPEIVMNLAAQAGVRYSLENPYAYVETNVLGFLNLLECARRFPVKHFVYASSSSVYGGNQKTPFEETDRVDNPVSVYAATKKCDELLAHVYTHLYQIPTTGLRFFTVYGPWGRPDMSPILFADAITQGRPIKVFNHGDMSRDFTYIDDIIEGVVRVIEGEPQGKVYNIGCGHPTPLMDFIGEIEKALGTKAEMEMLPMQPGDVYTTYADTTALARDYGYSPTTPLREGIAEFVAWYKEHYQKA